MEYWDSILAPGFSSAWNIISILFYSILFYSILFYSILYFYYFYEISIYSYRDVCFASLTPVTQVLKSHEHNLNLGML